MASERYLDEKGLDRPPPGGPSRWGDFVALELARRGRAMFGLRVFRRADSGRTISGCEPKKKGRRGLKLVRHIRPIMPLVMKSALLRRQTMRE